MLLRVPDGHLPRGHPRADRVHVQGAPEPSDVFWENLAKDKDYTKITFWPDLARFGMKKLDDDIVGLMMRRAFDIAGSTAKKIKVILNGKKLAVSAFEEYVNLYVTNVNGGGAEGAPPVVYEKCSDRWEVAVRDRKSVV